MNRVRPVALFALLSAPGLALAAPATPRISVIDDLPEEAPAPTAETPTLDASRLAEARRLGTRGLSAYDQHDYEAAIERLTDAIELHDAPSLRLYRARSYAKLERWGAACNDFDAIRRSPVAQGETPIAAQARAAAKPEGTEACARAVAHSPASAPAQPAATMSPADVDPVSVDAVATGRGRPPELELDVSFFGLIHNQVAFSREAFNSYEHESSSTAGRVELGWHPLPAPVRDWIGFGATWVQDYGMGQFSYTEAIGSVISRYGVGPVRFAAQLGAGFLRPGMDVLNQRYVVLKPSFTGGVRFGDFSTHGSIASVIPLEDVGTPLYTRYSGYGLEGCLALEYHLWRWFGAQVSVTASRLDLELASPEEGTSIDIGAPPPSVTVADRYTSLFLSVTAEL